MGLNCPMCRRKMKYEPSLSKPPATKIYFCSGYWKTAKRDEFGETLSHKPILFCFKDSASILKLRGASLYTREVFSRYSSKTSKHTTYSPKPVGLIDYD